MKHLLLIITFLVSTTTLIASSFTGGDLSYEKVGSSSYKVQLKLYRDCTTGSLPFETSVKIKVRKGLGVITGLDFDMPLMTVNQISQAIDSCSFGTCLEEAIYISTVTLSFEPEGYHLFYVSCCRDGGIDNITNPSNAGEVINTFIPSPINWGTNSSPSWSNSPEVIVCQGQNFNFDHSATDNDGDSLAYSLYTPYSDTIPTFNNSLTPPNNIQFSPVSWGTGFSMNNPFNNSGTPLTINATTGILSGIGENLGQFIVGIKCEEYRGGVKIGEIVRDFQYQVFDCSSSKEAKIGYLNGCKGNIINMVNESSSAASNFYWDFGDGSAGSTDFEPTHSFPGTGNFTVTLISQYGTPCADTTTQLLKIGVVFPDFIASTDSTCIDSPVNFSETSVAYGDMTINSKLWDFDDGTTSTDSTLSHTFSESGSLWVKFIVGTDSGCLDSIIKIIHVQGLPIVDVGPDTAACYSDPNLPLDGIITNATGGMWTGNGGAFSPDSYDLNAIYIPSAAELTAGQTQLILHTTGNGLCPSSTDTLNIVFIDQPLIDVGPNLEICADTTFIPLNATVQYTNGVQWYTTNGTGAFINPQLANTIYIPSSIDFSLDSVQFIAKTINNGGCNENADTLWIKFTIKPTISYIYTDTICENSPIHLNAFSLSGVNGIWSTDGDGTFTTPTLNITEYNHGTLDLGAQKVNIYFETTNNGLCSTQYDTLEITIIPSPTVDFTTNQVCSGIPTEFTSNVTSTSPISDYNWMINSTLFSTAQDTSYILPNDTNDITLIVFTSQGCSDTIKKTIIIPPSPTANFNINNPCSNTSTQFLDSSYIVGGTISNWDWNFGDGTTDNIEDPNHSFSTGAIYNVQLIVTSTNGCTDTITKPVSIHTGPKANFSATPTSGKVGDAISFVDLSTGSTINYWEWDFNDGDFSYDKNPSHSYNNGGKYNVSLFVEDINGCSDSTQKTITILVKPSIPSAFSPNGDGNNDFLKVYGGSFETLTFRVYNNWGKVIYEASDILEGWDGKYKGVDQPIGVYVWSLKAITKDGVKYEISGDVSLIR